MKARWVMMWCHAECHDGEEPALTYAGLATSALAPSGHVIQVPTEGDRCSECHGMGHVLVLDIQAGAYARGRPVEMAAMCSCTSDPSSERTRTECRQCRGTKYVIPLGMVADAARRLGADERLAPLPPRPWDWRAKYEPEWVSKQIAVQRQRQREAIEEALRAARAKPVRDDGPSPYQREYGNYRWQPEGRNRRKPSVRGQQGRGPKAKYRAAAIKRKTRIATAKRRAGKT